jgi:nucleotide-binding universal stress UspA family protein
MYDSVLVPTDGSQWMADVVDQAIELASICDATLHAFHVIDERAYYSVPDDARDRVRETLRADAESFIEAIAERALEADLEVEREVRWGDPAPTILSYAVENRVGCVVMGTHGRTGYERYLLGSVAEKVVRMAPMPVLAIAIGDTDEQRRQIMEATPATGRSSAEEDPEPDAGMRSEGDSEPLRFD